MELVLSDETGGENASKKVGPTSVDFLGASLTQNLRRCITDRSLVEQRWLQDLQQYLGEYDEQTLNTLREDDRSSVFLNITRVIVNQSESQLSDLLFPAEDKNYGLAPTPNPDIERDLDNEEEVVNPLTQQSVMDPQTQQPVTNGDVARKAMDIAKTKSRAMERRIDDQFVECDYAAEARKCLHQASIFGTGVLVGPERTNKRRERFITDPETGASTLELEITPTAVARCVNVWDFYPDMSGSTLKEAEFTFERSFMTRKQMRSLLTHKKGYLEKGIRSLLETDPKATHVSAAGHVDELRRLTGGDIATSHTSRYEMWTYRGPIEKDALIDAGVEIDPDDPLQELDGVVVFCQDTVVKVALNPLESENWPYSVWNWQEDDFSIFGFGVPWLCRNEQRIVNASWRLMLDNATKSAGPQVVAKRSALSPADGDNTIRPWKMWWADETITDVRSAFTVFTFPSVQQEVANILTLAKSFLVETAGLPPSVGQGQGQTPNTLGGMAMLMNSSNTDRRRQVRNWDDNVTKPMVSRFYHWNMQYDPDPEIKGDYEVHARGSSARLLREQQAINLMGVLDKYAGHPVLMPFLKADEALRKLVQALHISPEELVKTPEEQEAEAKAAAEQEPEVDPQVTIEQMRAEQTQLRAQTQLDIAQMKSQFEGEEREGDRQLRRDLAMLEATKLDRQLQMEALRHSQATDTNYQKILADLKKNRWRLNLEKAKFEKEIEIKEKQVADQADKRTRDDA